MYRKHQTIEVSRRTVRSSKQRKIKGKEKSVDCTTGETHQENR